MVLKYNKGTATTPNYQDVATSAKATLLRNRGALNSGNVEDALLEILDSISSIGNTTPPPSGGGDGRSREIWVEDYKTSSNSWGDALQLAFNAAKTKALSKDYTTIQGSINSGSANSIVTIGTGIYQIDKAISVPFGVDFNFNNVVFESTAPKDIANYDCLQMAGNCYRNEFKMPIFVGFRRGFAFSTANRDTCVIKISGGGAINCKNFIDDISYQMSRSTQLEISNFVCVATHQPFRIHTDDSHIHDGWVYHSGYNVECILSQSRMLVENVIFIPRNIVESNDDKVAWTAGWTYSEPAQMINYALGITEDADSLSFDSKLPANKLGTVGNNNRGITFRNCVFGGEFGSMPVVNWYGETATNLNTSNALHNHIRIEDCSAETGNRTINRPKALIVIKKDLPSIISLRTIIGLSSATDGLIYMAPSASRKHTVAGDKWKYEIHIGEGVRGRPSYPVTNDPSLYEFITTTTFVNRDIKNFSDLALAKKSLGDSNYTPPTTPETPTDPETPPVGERTPIRYIRVGGVRADTNNTFLPAEIEAWVGGTNILLNNTTWTAPVGTTRSNNTYPTDGQRNHLSPTITNSDTSKLYMTFDLGQGYTTIDRVNILFYIGLAHKDVFLDVSEDGETFRRAWSTSQVTHSSPGYAGTDILANDLY